MSSAETSQSARRTVHPTCTTCDAPITPGHSRYPTRDGPVHEGECLAPYHTPNRSPREEQYAFVLVGETSVFFGRWGEWHDLDRRATTLGRTSLNGCVFVEEHGIPVLYVDDIDD